MNSADRCLNLCALCALLFSSLSLAESVPPLINYQGRLADRITGTTNLSFSIYTNATVGAAVWGPQVFTDAHVVDGFYSVVLGEDANTNSVTEAFTRAETWVECVSGDTTNARQQILSVPYAAQAEWAASRTVGTNAPVGGVARSEVCTEWGTGDASFSAITNLQVTLAVSGRPVRVMMTGAGTSASSYLQANRTEKEQAGARIQIKRQRGTDAPEVVHNTFFFMDHQGHTSWKTLHLPADISFVDFPPSPGVYTYWVEGQVAIAGHGAALWVWNVRLVAYEL